LSELVVNVETLKKSFAIFLLFWDIVFKRIAWQQVVKVTTNKPKRIIIIIDSNDNTLNLQVFLFSLQ